VSFTAFMMYALVLQVERKVVLVEVIDDFLKTTLEIRRYEKNYFLYGQRKDFDDALFFWQTLKQLLDRHAAELNRLVPSTQIQFIMRIMSAYKEDLIHLETLNGKQKQGRLYERLQDEVRRNGKLMTDFAEQTVLAERASIKTLLHTTRSIQVISAIVLVLLSTTMAIVLGRKILSSLRLLEGYTRKISHGEMLDPLEYAVEEEINVLLRAFHRMNRELQARQRQLVQSEKLAALGTLLAGVAHELNNPLSNISTSAQILTEEIDHNDLDFKKNLLSQIEVQTDKARDIVRTLLEFSRVKEFHKERIALRQLMTETMRLIKGQVPKDIKIGIDIADDILIFVDKQRMQQVFLNLIKNSIDALGATDQHGHIWVTAQKSGSPHGNVVEILIEDDGPGISPEVREKIFDPFFTTKDVGQGSGLGLYIVHDIIESHGGDITVESSPAGSTFIIWLKDEAGD
jgi:signal transduction histidine kinase